MKIKCPVCSKKSNLEENPWRPFCSERCKFLDLGKWTLEEYKIAGEDIRKKEDAEQQNQ